ncbi:MAG: anaerobic ribonucleoside-triphosphate reductase activating protein [Eubacteriales bacterium]|nr:anaerobic ribonucleoside-triphosphate reductase activating protein [Eubacteriales bacterium]
MKDHTIRIAGVIDESIVDGPGIRFVIFTQGCPHHCPGCHNPQTHDFAAGHVVHISQLLADIQADPLISGVTLSGGEPFCQPEPLAELVRVLKQGGKHIMAYTGYTWEQLLQMDDPAVGKLLRQCDIVVDGPFIQAQRDLSLRFRGSRNQRLIDVQKSLQAGEVVTVARKYT